MAAERGNRFNRWLDRYAGIPLSACAACVRRVTRACRRCPPGAGRTGLPPRHVGDAGEVRHVGLICLGAIGDLLLLSALVNGVRARLPRATLELVVSYSNAGAAPLLHGVDRVSAFDVREVLDILRHVRSQRYDLLLDSSQWARLGSIVTSLSGAGLTVGFATAGQYRGLGYDIAVSHRADRHEVENFLALGRAVFPGLEGEPRLHLPEDLSACAPKGGKPGDDGWRQELENEAGRPRAFLHMWPSGVQRQLKEWPAGNWATLARELARRGYSIWFTGSAPDAGRNTDFLRAHMAGEAHVHSLAGRVTLSELACLLRDAAAVVSVNTGIMHLAALVGAPTVGLHGATNPRRWGPVGPRAESLLPRAGQCAYLNLGFEYPRGAAPSLVHLPVEDVLAALDRVRAL